MKLRNPKILENLIYALLWLVVFVVPVFGLQDYSHWYYLYSYWLRLLPFFAIFLVHNYVLVPYFLLRQRTRLYLGVTLGTIVFVFGILLLLLAGNHRRVPPFFVPDTNHTMAMPDTVLPSGVVGTYDSLRGTFLPGSMPHPHHLRMPANGLPPRGSLMWLPFRTSPLISDILVAILVVGLNVAIRLLFKSIRDEHHIKALEGQNLQAELNYLKTQINPHFFMNTLNNIHALIDIDANKAKDTILELSKIMRYVLYDADQARMPLVKEIGFLRNYVSLMRIRFINELEVVMDVPDQIPPEAGIAPLLLVTLVENAFKHGVSHRQPSFIHMQLAIVGHQLYYLVENSCHQPSQLGGKSGVGLDNLRKRLSLLYGNKYTLDIGKANGAYRVLLIIPVDI